MERQRDDAVKGQDWLSVCTIDGLLCCQMLGDPLAEVGSDGQAMLVFERLNEPIEREGVEKRGDGRVEVRWLGEAPPTTLAGRCRLGALWAAQFGQQRKIGDTSRAKDVACARGAAEQAVLWQQPGAESPEEICALR